MHIYTYIYTHIYISIYVRIYVHMYTYVCTYVCTYIHTYTCTHLKDLWLNISNVMALNIDYHVIITGKSANLLQNQIISLLCYLLFKKFIKDINNFQELCVKQYLKKELNLRLDIYKKITTNKAREMIRNVLYSI